VLSDVFYFIPFFWICVQYFRYEVLGVLGNEFGKLKVGIKNLFVELASIWVFKG
jgi:hypothetical protein